MILSARNVCVSVHGTGILHDVSLTVRPGECLGLIGPNGSGKSTFLRCLAGLRAPNAGQVTLDGAPVRRIKPRDLAQRLALVEQQAETTDRITVRDAVELGRTPFLSALRPWSRQDDARVADALEAVEMSAFADRLWHTLSGGERQRVHIARALAQEPRILLLDEPTNHLDIRHQLSILELVRGLPVTVAIALHDLNQAMACDRLAMMDRGRLIACASPAEVLTEGRLRAVFGVEATFLSPEPGSPPLMRFRKAI